MTCEEFVERFSEYYDRTGPEEVLLAAQEHMSGCRSCRRYHEVVERGTRLLHSLGEVEVSRGFRPRLRHRLYHVDHQMALMAQVGSGATAMTVLGMAVLLTLAAWSPTLRPGIPMVELAPIVVSAPQPRTPAAPALSGLVHPAATFPLRNAMGLWDDAPALLLQYSALAERYRRGRLLRRAGLDQDR